MLLRIPLALLHLFFFPSPCDFLPCFFLHSLHKTILVKNANQKQWREKKILCTYPLVISSLSNVSVYLQNGARLFSTMHNIDSSAIWNFFQHCNIISHRSQKKVYVEVEVEPDRQQFSQILHRLTDCKTFPTCQQIHTLTHTHTHTHRHIHMWSSASAVFVVID